MVTLKPGQDLKASGFVAEEHCITLLLTNFCLSGCDNWRCGPSGRFGVALVFSADGIVFQSLRFSLRKFFSKQV
jgi:hypothetical protein